MIIVIDALNKHDFGSVLDEMHKLRAREFGDRLGWDVTLRDGREADTFDALDPAYVICLDEAGAVVGCLRLLQTTGPHMLDAAGTPPLRSARLWEATRLCVDTARLSGGTARASITHTAAELLIGVLEYARAAGVLDLVAVIDPETGQTMRHMGNAPCDDLGPCGPARIVLMECSDARIDAIRDSSGIAHDVFLSEAAARALRDRVSAQPSSENSPLPPGSEPSALRRSLQAYARAQLHAATTRKEVEAARALIDLLSEKFGTAGAVEMGRVQEFLPRHSRQQALAPVK